MRAHEAKDFLVAQIKQQAALEGVPLSDLEIQMLYFTESGGASQRMQKLAEEFDESCDMKGYEAKISPLMKHAYKRLKKNDPAAKETWDSAIRCLRKGDHYILVMWGSSWRTQVPVILLVAFIYLVVFGFRWLEKTFPPPNPKLLLGIFLGAAALYFLFQRQVGQAFSWLLEHTVDRFIDPKDEK